MLLNQNNNITCHTIASNCLDLFIQGTARIARNVHACAGVYSDYSAYMVTDLSLRARDRREDLGRDTNRIAKKELTIFIRY